MSPQISQEALLIVMSLYGGLVLAVCYDMVRVCRRIFKVGIVSMIIQDVIYWTISAIFMFNIYLKYNYSTDSTLASRYRPSSSPALS